MIVVNKILNLYKDVLITYWSDITHVCVSMYVCMFSIIHICMGICAYLCGSKLEHNLGCHSSNTTFICALAHSLSLSPSLLSLSLPPPGSPTGMQLT